MVGTIPRHISIEKDFEEFFKEQFSLVYNYIYYRVGNREEAEDLTSDVFVKAYQYWNSFSMDKGSRGAWLGGIARNVLRSYFQKEAKKSRTIELPEHICSKTNIENNYLQKEELEQIFGYINSLPQRKQDIFAMKYLMGLTNRDIGKIIGVSENNVSVTLHRIIKNIQKKIKIV